MEAKFAKLTDLTKVNEKSTKGLEILKQYEEL